MTTVRWTCGCLITIACMFLVSAQYDDDLPGPYCATKALCCNGRQDECSVPILGTLCYCDEFCNQTRVEDCCPDYWYFCRGITPPPRPTTTPYPPPRTTPGQAIGNCTTSDGRVIPVGGGIHDNCNLCKCEIIAGRQDKMCEQNVCIVDPDVIERVNDDPTLGWKAVRHEPFWGRTLDDGVTFRLGTKQPQKFILRMNPVRRIYDKNTLPREFESKDKWPRYISKIKDQGWCGSSWAISTADVASDRFGIISKGLEEIQLSAQNLISCHTRGQQSCNGGYLDKAWSFIRKFGLVDEDCFPYKGTNAKCTIKRHGSLVSSGCRRPARVQRESRYKVGPAYRLGNETDIMYEITRSGPVQATMKVYQDFFSYKGGIYTHSNLGDMHKIGYLSVRIVGWGEENTYRGVQKYWKVANSWGTDWGENGFFRIAKGSNECEIESFVLATWPEIEQKLLVLDGI